MGVILLTAGLVLLLVVAAIVGPFLLVYYIYLFFRYLAHPELYEQEQRKAKTRSGGFSFLDRDPLMSIFGPGWKEKDSYEPAAKANGEQKVVRFLSPENKEVSAENKTLSDPSIVQYYPGPTPVRFESSQKEEQ